VLAGAGSEDLWARTCRVLGLENLLADERFIDNARRVAHRDELRLESAMATEPAQVRRVVVVSSRAE